MPEAEALSDRILIVKKGNMACIGDSITLKSKYCTDYKMTINFKHENKEIVRGYLKELEIPIEEDHDHSLCLSLPFEKIQKIFKLIGESEKARNVIDNWEFNQTSLEEVFHQITIEED